MAQPTDTHMQALPPIKEAQAEDWVEEPSYPMDYKPKEEEAKEEETPETPEAKVEEAPAPVEGAETPPDAPESAPEEEAAAEPTDDTKAAQAWRAMEESFGRNPHAFVNQLFQLMPQDQQQAFLSQFVPQAQEADPTADFRPDDELTTEELYVKRHVAPTIQQAQRFQTEVSGWTQKAAEVMNGQTQYIQKLEASLTAMQKDIADLKGAAVKKAARVPDTPRNGAGGERSPGKIPDDANMIDIFNALKRRAGSG